MASEPVSLGPEDSERLREEASRRGIEPEELAHEAIVAHLESVRERFPFVATVRADQEGFRARGRGRDPGARGLRAVLKVLLLDTGVLVAATVVNDPDHGASVRLLSERRDRVVSCLPVLTEAAYLVRAARRDAPGSFVRDIVASVIELEHVSASDLTRVAELLDQYADLRLDFTDAVLIAVAERLAVTEIATLDRRDFSVVRPRHVDAFTLLP